MEPVKNTKNFLNRVPGVEKLITTEEEMNIETMEAEYLAQIGDYQSQINRLMMESTEKDDEIEALERDIVDLNNQLAEYQSQIVSQNEQQARLEEVVSTYTDMEPESAARILSETTTEIAVDILNGVPSEARSEILSFMETEKAAELTELLYQ
jgi:flagellar motility protein MotE (MotC chaperone)